MLHVSSQSHPPQSMQRMNRRDRRRAAFTGLSASLALSLAACVELPTSESAGDAAATESETSAQPNNPRNPNLAAGGEDPNRPRSMNQRARPPRDQRPPAQPLSVDPNQPAATFPLEFRTIDGFGNNLTQPDWGAADTAFLRLAPANYGDGSESPAGANRLSARLISNVCAAQVESLANNRQVTDYLWQWGQFLDHDINETPVADPSEAFDIPVPADDALFDPNGSGTQTIPLDRSSYVMIDGARQQIHEITAFIDASNVYGADEERAAALRTLDGTGRLLTSDGDLLPFNDAGLDNAPANSPNFFLAGDIRANEQVGLTAMHTLFMREHNYWAAEYASLRPEADGEAIYQFARAIVTAEMLAITYREFLPILLGSDAVPPYRGYDSTINPGIANEFATAAYRVGHSMLSETLLRLDADGGESANGHLSLAEAFFNPQHILDEGIDSVLRGLAAQAAQRIDNYVVDSVRNFLFGPPGAGGFDLAALNIQRGRDHGLADYNTLRTAFGLPAVASFTAINPDPEVALNLAAAYANVDDIDAWVGGLAEQPINGGLVGETWSAILVDQFRRLRDGDRFWYQAYLPGPLVELVEQQTLNRIIRRNTVVGDELRPNVFLLNEPVNQPDPNQPPRLDLATVLAQLEQAAAN